MYLNKSSKGIGWYSFINKTYAGEKTEDGMYLNFIFKKGAEPQAEAINGDLFFIDAYGNKRLVLPYIDDYNGNRQIKFRLMDVIHQVNDFDRKATEPKEDNSNMGGKASQSGQSIGIEPNDLPFY